MRKILYVILDGLGDRPVPHLGGRTPLAAAHTPSLDWLARRGRTGLVTTVGEGIAPESDVAVFAILGYDPRAYHTGRGPIEALGAGLTMRDGDLALRGNFATVGEDWKIVDRRVGRNLTSEEAHRLAESVTREVHLGGASFAFRATIGHRGVLVLYREGGLSSAITNTDPAYDRAAGGLGVAKAVAGDAVEWAQPLDAAPAARAAADLVNEFVRRSHEVMERDPVNERRRREGKMPGNAVLLRDAGDHLPQVPSMQAQTGVTWGCFVEMPVERGIALLTGMAIIEVPPSSPGDRSGAYREWAARAADEISRHGGLYLHLKGPDEPGHDGDAEGKVRAIEQIDRHFFGDLLARLGGLGGAVIAVTADHATPVALRSHSDDPVPLLVAGAGIAGDGTAAFTEADAARGSLGHLRGVEVVPLVVGCARL